jgi:hypothetical protein
MDCVIGRHAHDSPHLIASSLVLGTVALSAYMVLLLKDGIILIALLLEIHTRGKPCRAAANDADLCVFADT